SASAAETDPRMQLAERSRRAGAHRSGRVVDLLGSAPVMGVDCARAWVASVEHRQRDVASPLVRCVDAGLADGSAFFATYAAWTAVRLGVVGRLPGAVRDLPSRVEGVLVGAWADGVVAGLDGDAAGLDAVGEQFVELGASIDAVEAFAAASRLWSTDGRARAATASIRRARESLGDSDVRTPGLVLSDDAVPLTDREREVADLAADGLAAREIAERLFISRRTVTNHLQHVYDKLGVSGRSELRTALGRG
ncbi:MAG TPA: helix-turn-helix transcriptional regulator, partial [Microthrixaceae bacterium]|nr:helix-turn-helix transcriptional regulator [Microthrixaceae bacterium]